MSALEKFKIKNAIGLKVVRSAPAKGNGKFVLLPWVWIERLDKIGADRSTWRIAIEITWRCWRERSATIVLPQIPAVSRNGRRSALRNLEAAALISIEYRVCKSPLVTINRGVRGSPL
jgi:hypothetical protein